MPERRLIEFAETTVEVITNVPSVLSDLDEQYTHLLSSNSSQLIASIALLERDGQYRLLEQDTEMMTGESLSYTFWTAMNEVGTRFMRYHRGLVWLHASAVSDGEECVTFVGPQGSGKSRLCISFLEAGWNLLSDEYVPIDPEISLVHPFPIQPRARIHPGKTVAEDEINKMEKEWMKVSQENVIKAPVKLGAIFFPRYVADAEAHIKVAEPAIAAKQLIENCMNAVGDRRTVISRACRLIESAPVYNLAYGNASNAVNKVQKQLGRLRPNA